MQGNIAKLALSILAKSYIYYDFFNLNQYIKYFSKTFLFTTKYKKYMYFLFFKTVFVKPMHGKFKEMKISNEKNIACYYKLKVSGNFT